MKNWWLFLALVMHMSVLLWGLIALKFSFAYPPNMKKHIFFFHILGLNLKISYQIASLFDMYIDMGERIAGNPPQGPLNALNIHFFENCFSNCFPLLYICLHCDEVCIFWHFDAPGTPGFYVGAQHDPDFLFFFFSDFCILTQKVLIKLLLYLTCKLILKRG